MSDGGRRDGADAGLAEGQFGPGVIADRLRRRGGIPDEIAAYVRHEILTGALRPGEKIDQESIASALDVSRSPIREALVVLGQEGLVDITPRRGAAVADLSAADVIDHYELVGLISGRAAAFAADNLSGADLDELAAIQDRFESDADPAEFSQLNNEFHRIINGAAPRRTRWLLGLLARSVPTDFFEITEGWNAQATEHHREILSAIIERDPARARAAMENHLYQSGVAAASTLMANGYWDDTDKEQS